MSSDGRPLPPEVARRMGPYYVYLLVDPRTQRPFYVGKGTGERLLAHGVDADLRREPGQSRKLDRIAEIRGEGFEPRLEVVRHGIPTEHEAFQIEAALIDCLPELTNAVSGHGTELGRSRLIELVMRYGAQPLPADIPPVLMIRLTPKWIPLREEMEPGYFRSGHGWRPEASPTEIFDAVRGWWKVGPQGLERRGVGHVVAVVEGVTRGIYEVDQWHERDDGRRAFSGTLVEDGPVWSALVGPWGRRVPFATHSQNPLVYWPPPRSA